MLKLQLILFCLSLLIIKSTASPIELEEKVRTKNEKWLARNKLASTDDNLWRNFFTLKAKLPSIQAFNSIETSNGDAQAIKSVDPRLREAINQLLSKLNSHQKETSSLMNNSPGRTVQSFYPKCDDSSELTAVDNEENKKQIKEDRFMSLYYDLKPSSINKPGNTILKANLRVYPKKTDEACECKPDSDENEDNQLKLSLYEILSKVTFSPFEEVSKKQLIETINFNTCCNQMITFDLTNLVQKWKMYVDSNNGLLLELTDNLGNKLNVYDYIESMNCSDKTLPIPYIKMIHPDLPNNLIKQTSLHYPTLDVAFNRKDLFNMIKNPLIDRNDKDSNV